VRMPKLNQVGLFFLKVLKPGRIPKSPLESLPFRVKARPLGTYPEVNYNCVSELLEQVEGPLHP